MSRQTTLALAATALLAAGPSAANQDEVKPTGLAQLAAMAEPEPAVNDATAFYLTGVRVYPPELFWVFVENWQDNDWQQQSQLRTYVATNQNPNPEVMQAMGADRMGAQVLAEIRPTISDPLVGNRSVDEWWISNHETFYDAWAQAKEARDEANKNMARMGGAGVAASLGALYFGRRYKLAEQLGVNSGLAAIHEQLGKRRKAAADQTPAPVTRKL